MTTPILPILEDFNLTVSGGVTSVFSLDHIIFEGLDVTDTGSGTVTVTATIPPPPPVITPGGNNGELQYNNVGVFGGATGVTYSSTGTMLTVAGGPISCPGSGVGSERFGAGSLAGGSDSVAIGPGADSPSPNQVSIGANAKSTSAGAAGVAIGSGATVTGNGGTAIGLFSAAGGGGVAIGTSVSAPDACISVGSTLVGTAVLTLKYGINLDSAAHSRTIMVGVGSVATGDDEVVLGVCQNAPDDQKVRWVGRSSVGSRDLHRFHHTKIDSTDATFTTRAVMSMMSHGSLVEYMRAEGDTGATAAKIGFLGAAAVTRPAVTGSRGGNTALASLLTALASLGLITDTTTP